MATENDRVTEFFARVYDGLEEGPQDPAALRRSLQHQGLDVEETVSKGLRLVADYQKRRRLQLAREKLERLREAVEAWTGATEQSLSAIKEEIARTLAGDQGRVAYQAYHRKLASVDEADLQSLGEDAALLEFIARIEADELE